MCFIEEKNFIERYGSFIASTLASFLALSIAIYGSKMRSWRIKPRFEIIKIEKYMQAGVKVWRLLIKNSGNDIAKDVQAEILKIYDNGNFRKNYLPAPLRWAHKWEMRGDSRYYYENRNIHPDQVAYLDLFDDTLLHSTEGKILIATTIPLNNIPDFAFLSGGESIIVLKIFEKNIKPITVKLLCKLENKNFNIEIIK